MDGAESEGEGVSDMGTTEAETPEPPAQRTPEWLEQRKGLVTASNVGAILGLSPFRKRADVMRDMVRDALGAENEFQTNVALEYGNNNEAGAIQEFEMETGLTVTPAPFVVHPDGWIGASPDGYVSDGSLIEVKAPFSLRKSPAPVPFKSIDDQEHYYAQMQIQMHCTGENACHFFQWAPNGTKLEIVNRNNAWLDKNLPILKAFHDEFLAELKNPDEHLAPKRVTIDTPKAAKMVREWDELSEQADFIKERKADLLAEMVKMAKEKNADFAGRRLTLTKKTGAISYAKAIKELLPDADLEKWRGKPTKYWGLR